MTPTRSLVESSLLAGLAVILFLAAQFLPFVGAAFSLLAPAPLVILGLRHDLKKAALGLAIATLLTAVFLGPLSSLFFLLGFGVLGIGLGFLARRCSSGVEVMLLGILLSLGSKLLLMVIAAKVTGINPFQLDGAEMQAMVDRIFGFYETAGMSRESLSAVKQQFSQAIGVLPVIFPTILTMAAALDCYLSYRVSGFVLKRIGGTSLPPLPPFSRWRFPKSVFGALLASVLLSVFGSQGGEWNMAMRIGTNVRMLVNFLFLFQGLSLFWYFLGGGDSPHRGAGRFLRTVAIIVAVLVPMLSTATVMVGIADMWLDFRTRFRRNDER
ncbi:hypothetical protein SDC9_44729 [bioreactor metagenome]|uniref:DUF2232 domain-containing protein n=1 Tax=bioreactor metagenome TaxID=1076179 RepID=A0A644W7U8_9ZZZZ|nr:YybS family protein [Aminivibrio sp.]MDD3514900.1 YybS family protein [Synergistaceae bacterium]MEA4953512.1 YybS family protein [Aminivibrio sp.]NCB16981.1 DUF2232 domain-containing protein [Synergistales bacterium]HPF84023.1 YybS family protein [Aminivibrio sp.]